MVQARVVQTPPMTRPYRASFPGRTERRGGRGTEDRVMGKAGLSVAISVPQVFIL